ncbi:alpha/beta fold hydrolase [Alkalilimnicola sp. S0819]|uniref:alpha/beta fold hydrolase n=1 Tax=Alkalilimnicola sp. S0819 TaxID=2613922 RepID=UPI001262AA7F|nr:alpha/beta fold hydrolase [Alkalilimnicola sp. S0819]KAB7624079.1 alpha/beta fold hydrolase [Alkalilimnicola sp. S0819]MPQ16329.1 alpha/beta fold hydrolase [Alkalilimnicola sp. S0819]
MTNAQWTEAGTSRFIDIKAAGEDLKIHYNDAGKGEQVVVMLHGSGPGATGWANFNRNVQPLTDAGYRVLLVDCPGWGKSDSIVCTGSRSDLNAEVLAGVVEGLNLPKVHIIGNSMGGHSAVAFALQHPERVAKLILMGGGTGGGSLFTPMPTEGIKRLQKLYREPTLDNLNAMMEIFVFDPSGITEEMMKTRLDNILAREDHLQNFVKSVQANPLQFPDYAYRLREVQADTLVVWGRDDRFVPMDTGLRLLAGLPKAQLHVFNRCGHWVQWEHAETFNRMVLDFLSH